MTGRRILLLGIMLCGAWAVLLTRTAWVQIVRASHYREIAQRQSVSRTVLQPQRGEIIDREGVRLAVNAKVDGASGATRVYPNGHLAGQVLGMVGRDGYGLAGLEFHLDRDLRGTDGWRYVRVDRKRRYAPGASDQVQAAIDGLGLRLTLDARVQSIAELALERAMRRTEAKAGVVIVMEPRTGDLLAVANYPFFDPNAKRGKGGEALRNHAVGMVYEPGSTFKMFTAAALVEERRIRANDTIDAEGGRWQLAGQWIRDTHPMSRISFADAVAHSSNIVFAKVSTRVSPVSFYKYLRSFGFGMKTGVAMPAEESGLLKPVASWSGRTQQTIAFGHEISATPLQVAAAFGAIANGGVLMRPRIVREWTDADGNPVREEPVREVRRVLSESSAAELRAMMAGVVDHGTAREIRHPYIPIAGKTGSAQKIDPSTGRYIEGSYYSSFAGMAPAGAPNIVCLVVIDDPKHFKFGGQAAAPVFREIVDRMSERGIGGRWPVPAEIVDAGAEQAPVAASAVERPGILRAALSTVMPGRGAASAKSSRASGAATVEAASAPAVRPAALVMPDLRDATLRDALVRLRALGVEVEYSGEGRVREQRPEPGTPLRRGDRARLVLGWGG